MTQDQIRAKKPKAPEREGPEPEDLSDNVPSAENVLADIDGAIKLAKTIEKREDRWTYRFRHRRTSDDCVC